VVEILLLKNRYVKTLQTLFLIFLIVNQANAGGVIIKIPPGIDLSEPEIRAHLSENTRTILNKHDLVEIVIYYFSLGIEKFTYSDDDSMSLTSQKGEIRALIKLKNNAVLKDVLFIQAYGNSRQQILESFSQSITDALNKK
jgi:hypothetical protein